VQSVRHYSTRKVKTCCQTMVSRGFFAPFSEANSPQFGKNSTQAPPHFQTNEAL
jgi:hypothetical protein